MRLLPLGHHLLDHLLPGEWVFDEERARRPTLLLYRVVGLIARHDRVGGVGDQHPIGKLDLHGRMSKTSTPPLP